MKICGNIFFHFVFHSPFPSFSHFLSLFFLLVLRSNQSDLYFFFILLVCTAEALCVVLGFIVLSGRYCRRNVFYIWNFKLSAIQNISIWYVFFSSSSSWNILLGFVYIYYYYFFLILHHRLVYIFGYFFCV